MHTNQKTWFTRIMILGVLSFCIMFGMEASAVNLEPPSKDKPVTRKEYTVLAGKVAAFEEQLAAKADTASVADSMTDLEARVEVLETVLETRTVEFTNEINVLMAKVAALETQLAAKADTMQVTALEAKVVELETAKRGVTEKTESVPTPTPKPPPPDFYGDDKQEEEPPPPPVSDYYGPQ